MLTGTTAAAPSSTAFCTISSIFSALGRPWYSVTRSPASVEGSSPKSRSVTSPAMEAISAEKRLPFMNTSAASPGFIRKTRAA